MRPPGVVRWAGAPWRRRRALAGIGRHLEDPETQRVSVLTTNRVTPWHRRLPGAHVHRVTGARGAREVLRTLPPTDLVIDDLTALPATRATLLTPMLGTLRPGGVLVLVLPPPPDRPGVGAVLRRIAAAPAPDARTADPRWVREAVLRVGVAEVLATGPLAVLRRSFHELVPDVAPYGAASPDGRTVDLGDVHRLHAVTVDLAAAPPGSVLVVEVADDDGGWRAVGQAAVARPGAAAVRLGGRVRARQVRVVPADGQDVRAVHVLVLPRDLTSGPSATDVRAGGEPGSPASPA
jgi:hypothetical protein